MSSNKIHPCLWFDNQASEATDFYCSVFQSGKVTARTELVTIFELDGNKFMTINGGPMFQKNPSISFFVVRQTQEEVRELWDQLGDGGSALMPLDQYGWSELYGWVQDRYGVNWQISTGDNAETRYQFTPCLMFVQEQCGKAREAIELYTSLFNDSSIVNIHEYTASDHDTTGLVKHGSFMLQGKTFIAMDSSADHHFQFNEAVSLVIECENQHEIDYYWDNLKSEADEGQCGWIKDRFGVSWQIIPQPFCQWALDPEKGPRVMEKVMTMKKLDFDALENA